MKATNRHILVVDDDEDDLKLTIKSLNLTGPLVKVVEAHDGVEAIEYLRCEGGFEARATGHPVVVLLDLQMPCANGLEVLRAIKNDPILKAIPVVIFTSSSLDADVYKSYELGANAYVVKPMDYTSFGEVVQEIRSFWLARNQHPPERAIVQPSAT